MHFLGFVLIFLFSRGWFFNFVCLEGEREKKGEKKTVGFHKKTNIWNTFFFFSSFFLWCLCWGYNTLSGICLVFYSISPFQNVRGVCFSPLHPLRRFMGPIIIHLFISIQTTTKTNTWMHSVQGLKHFDLCYKVKSLDFWFVNNIWSS